MDSEMEDKVKEGKGATEGMAEVKGGMEETKVALETKEVRVDNSINNPISSLISSLINSLNNHIYSLHNKISPFSQ